MSALENKTALITGAGRGIGLAIAKAFVDAGAEVYLSDLDGDQVQQHANALGKHAHGVKLDVRSETDWTEIRQQLPSPDIVVNNAGITGLTETPGPHDPENVDLESWRAVLQTNLDGVVLGCRYAIQTMKSRGGAIINIASRSGLVGVPAASAYAASKAAVINHTRSVALHCANHRYPIRCNAIAPAAVFTEMWDAMLGEGPAREAMIGQIESGIPMGRFGQPNEVADMAVFLASNQSSYMTGAILDLDGGIRAGEGAPPPATED